MAETSATPVRTITLRDLQLGQVALTPEQREQMAAAETTIAELKAEGRSVLDAEGNQVQQVPEEGELVALLPMEGG